MFPSVFLSHGAPTLIRDTVPAREFLCGLGRQLGRPQAILCVSAHWDTLTPCVSGAESPPTIHDFYGFPPELYKLTYQAPGHPLLAARVVQLLESAGLCATIDATRGLDHGAWIPLSLAYPGCDVPVFQLSVQSNCAPEHHLVIGEALRPLRGEGVLIIANGGATHNLRGFGGQAVDAPAPDYVRKFDRWLRKAITDGCTERLLSYRERGPESTRNHPTPEHFLPLIVAAGAASDGTKGTPLHSSFTFGILSMAAFAWD